MCNRKEKGKGNAPQCREYSLCPRCNKIRQEKQKKARFLNRTHQILKRNLVPVTVRCSVPDALTARESLGLLKAALAKYTQPWGSRATTRRTDVWYGNVIGARTGIHVLWDERGKIWRCHAHILVWLSIVDQSELRVIKSLLCKNRGIRPPESGPSGQVSR
jgi:hypothetical protein